MLSVFLLLLFCCPKYINQVILVVKPYIEVMSKSSIYPKLRCLEMNAYMVLNHTFRK